MKKKLFSLICLLFVILFVIYNSNISYGEIKESETIRVEVKGEVKKDKVLVVKNGSRLIDILDDIDLNENVDLSCYSLNETLHNNQVIVFEDKSEEHKVSINNANIKELTTLPGIGEKIAQRIIEYRDINGSFTCLEDIKLVKGIGDNKYEKFKEYICL